MSLRADLPDQYVNVNGMNVRYIEKGSGHPLVCFHGLGVGLSADQFLVNVDAFSKFAHVYAFDMPPWGLSDYSPNGYSFPFWAETARGFCDALNLDQVDVVGQSVGGWFAALYASEYPDRVRRVILVGAAGLNPAPPRAAGEVRLPDRDQLRASLYSEWREFHPITDEMVDEQVRRMERPGRAEQYGLAQQVIFDTPTREKYSLRQRLPSMQHPLLAAWGDNPRAIRLQYGIEAARLAPNGRLLITFGGDHSAMGFTAKEFEAAATTFLTAEEIKPVDAQDKVEVVSGS